MNTFALITTVMVIHLSAWLTPGPIFVLIIRNSLVYSRKTGFWTAVGIAVGGLVHILYSVTGIAIIISTSSFVFNIIKFLGVGYLLYLGVKTILIKIKPQEKDVTAEQNHLSPMKAFKIGFLADILSPKASLFFASIFAGVLSVEPPLWAVIFLIIAMPLNSLIMASVLSVFFSQKRIRGVYFNYQNIVNKFLGLVLIILAIMIAFH